ncbi:MAG: 50S ribosomal protein L5, partial [Rhodospirillaceae bacterium]|nr:50S ribosomal protein L5 [Rhodospirillaceae bacterium]
MTRLNESFVTEIKPSLISHFGYKNVMQVPKVDKIVLNMGVGEASQDKKKIESAFNEMTLISGQKP